MIHRLATLVSVLNLLYSANYSYLDFECRFVSVGKNVPI